MSIGSTRRNQRYKYEEKTQLGDNLASQLGYIHESRQRKMRWGIKMGDGTDSGIDRTYHLALCDLETSLCSLRHKISHGSNPIYAIHLPKCSCLLSNISKNDKVGYGYAFVGHLPVGFPESKLDFFLIHFLAICPFVFFFYQIKVGLQNYSIIVKHCIDC
jgi:hypothetical protein